MKTSIANVPNVEFNWLGWISTVERLRYEGWQISAQEDFQNNSLNIAINHPEMRIQGFVHNSIYGLHERMYRTYEGYPEKMALRLQLAQKIIIHNTAFEVPWYPVTAVNNRDLSIVSQSTNLEDYALFESLPKKDITVVKPSFDKILQMALEHQAPKQKELREKARSKVGALLRIAI